MLNYLNFPKEPSKRLKQIKIISPYKKHELLEAFSLSSLPVLKKNQTQKKLWDKIEGDNARPELTIEDSHYKTLQESAMILESNKRLHSDIGKELNDTYRGKLLGIIKEHQTQKWREERMPKVKKTDLLNLNKKTTST